MSKATVYEHAGKQGRSKVISVNDLSLNQVFSLAGIGMNDRISSLEWDIQDGRKLIFYEHAEGQGRQYAVTGKGVTADLKSTNDFNDRASSYRYVVNDTVPEYFDFISPEPQIVSFNSANSKHGTDGGLSRQEHYQGVQVIDDKHAIICMSDFSGAYFFIVRWENGLLAPGDGRVIKQVLINEDFPGMKHNHPGCMQVLGNTVAIPVEFIGGTGPEGAEKSVVVFYDISNRQKPVKIDLQIARQDKPASALGMIVHDNRILLAVAGRDGQDIDFYRSQKGQTKITDTTVFGLPFKNWRWDKNTTNTEGWVNEFWGSRYEAINFIKDFDDQLYLVAFRFPSVYPDSFLLKAPFGVELYSVNPGLAPESMLKKLSVKGLYCNEGASTEWGSGVYTTGKKIHFLITGTGRSDKEYDNRIMKLNHF